MSETKRVVMVVSEGTFDKGMMAMMIANTAASMGMDVHIFFTFFGLNLLKKGVSAQAAGDVPLVHRHVHQADGQGRGRGLPGAAVHGLGPGREHLRLQHHHVADEHQAGGTWSTGPRYWGRPASSTSPPIRTCSTSSDEGAGMSSTLFILMKSPHEYHDLDAVAALGGDDRIGVLLFEDAVLFSMFEERRDELMDVADEVYLMGDDLEARGFKGAGGQGVPGDRLSAGGRPDHERVRPDHYTVRL